MNKIIKEQLKKCVVANVPSYDDNTTHLQIKKYNEIKLVENSYYLIRLSSSITNPPSNSVLASNWNNGSVPKHSYFKCEISRVMGTMIKINGLAYDMTNNKDLNEMWSGWLPIEGIEVISKL